MENDAESVVPPRRRVVVILVAFAVFLAPVLLVWALGREGGSSSTEPPEGDYVITFPEEPRSLDNFETEVVASTNLPEGTIVSVATTNEGSCCPPVQDGKIVVTTQNSTCFGFAGDAANSPGFEVTIRAEPHMDFEYPGPFLAGERSDQPTQPDQVVEILGEDFERLTGEQVVEQPDGSRALVATASFGWPEPQCGGDPLPLFGGADCEVQEGQLQGGSLDDAMGEVMGALAQARMCEFWGLMLPPDVEAEHPWPQFSAEWRDWYLNPPKDFFDAVSDSTWSNEAFTWHVVEVDGDRQVVEVTHHGEPVVRLELTPLPDYCPNCDPNVVPFWGVVGWQLF